MDTLVETTRNEIANCVDKAFEKIPVDDLARMLYLKNDTLPDFIKKVSLFEIVLLFTLKKSHDRFLKKLCRFFFIKFSETMDGG